MYTTGLILLYYKLKETCFKTPQENLKGTSGESVLTSSLLHSIIISIGFGPESYCIPIISFGKSE